CYNRLEPHLYFTRTFMNENVESKTQILPDFEPHRDSIEQQTKALFEEIFNPEIPFAQTEKTDNCKYCKFIDICNRN
ncbi:MAG: PD-(D/E)XK nuclease family protein, partial [Bacteroidales bacterium]|nr:PD-(D/E)XK nuclease family protein [Bacteroidales bacterium]